MPEGPEIRLAADRIAKVLAGRPVVEAKFGIPALRRFEKRIEGSLVTRIDTRGKAMLTRFGNGLTLYSHNQLYGRWYTTRRPRLPDTRRQLRVALHTPTHSALLYSASDIEVLTDKQLERHPFLTRIGPDILDPALAWEQVAERLASSRFRKRSVASLYLDQGFLAGIGNYLRSEILWAAAVHPALSPMRLSENALHRLARETLRISRRSYRTRGVTVPPALAKSLKAQGLSYQQYRFQVYGRAGQECHGCGGKIARNATGGRGVFYCETCQPG